MERAAPLLVVRLDLALELEQQGLALAVEGLAGGNLDPAFADAVFLDVEALLAVETDADVAFEGGRQVMGAARVGRQVGRGGREEEGVGVASVMARDDRGSGRPLP